MLTRKHVLTINSDKVSIINNDTPFHNTNIESIISNTNCHRVELIGEFYKIVSVSDVKKDSADMFYTQLASKNGNNYENFRMLYESHKGLSIIIADSYSKYFIKKVEISTIIDECFTCDDFEYFSCSEYCGDIMERDYRGVSELSIDKIIGAYLCIPTNVITVYKSGSDQLNKYYFCKADSNLKVVAVDKTTDIGKPLDYVVSIDKLSISITRK